MDCISILLLAVGCFNLWMIAMDAISPKKEWPDSGAANNDRSLGIAGFSVLIGTFGLLAGAAVTRIRRCLCELEQRQVSTTEDAAK